MATVRRTEDLTQQEIAGGMLSALMYATEAVQSQQPHRTFFRQNNGQLSNISTSSRGGTYHCVIPTRLLLYGDGVTLIVAIIIISVCSSRGGNSGSHQQRRGWTSFPSDLGRRITQSVFLFQRLSVLIQRYNAVAVLGTFAHTTPEDEM